LREHLLEETGIADHDDPCPPEPQLADRTEGLAKTVELGRRIAEQPTRPPQRVGAAWAGNPW